MAAYGNKFIYLFICLLITGSESKISFILLCYLLPTVLGEGTLLSMAPAGACNEYNRARYNLCN